MYEHIKIANLNNKHNRLVIITQELFRDFLTYIFFISGLYEMMS